MKRTGTKYTKRMRSKICIWGWQRSTCLGVMSRRTKKIWVSSGVKKTSSRNKSTQKWHNFCKKIASISSFTSPTCSKDDYLFFKSCFFFYPIYIIIYCIKFIMNTNKAVSFPGKVPYYRSDGTGRDTYIREENGGLLSKDRLHQLKQLKPAK